MNGQTIFISYKHDDNVESYVKKIEAGLTKEKIGYSIDVKDLKYRDNIREYEELIGKSSRCIVIITPEYLESAHCMYELVQIFKAHNVQGRVFPVVDTGKYIRDSSGLDLLRNFWLEKRESVYHSASCPSPSNARELGDIDSYLQKLDEIWEYLRDINTSDIKSLTDNDAEQLVAAILKDIEEKNSAKSEQKQEVKLSKDLTNIIGDAQTQRTIHQYGNNSMYIENNNGSITINH